MKSLSTECCILGAGPAGLATALELVSQGKKDIILIDRNPIPGGLSRTVQKDNYRFDVGPHRFFTQNKEINKLWHNTLGKDFIPVDRLTRIYYKNKFFNYPIKAGDVITKLSPVELAHAIVSFAYAKTKINSKDRSFEDWISNRFGKKLFDTFFKTYTEKVWGIPCSEIGAEWAAQRIKGLNLFEVVRNSFNFGKRNNIKTLVDQFDYPVKGAGQMYEAWSDTISKNGGQLFLGSSVDKIVAEDHKIKEIQFTSGANEKVRVQAGQYFSSIPITHFFYLQDNIGNDIKKAIDSLYYREHITVDLLIDQEEVFPDQWIYIHSPDVRMARIANYNNFSKYMVNHEPKTALSVEYFVFQSEELWKMSDQELIELASRELALMKLVEKQKIITGWVVRETESYPTYYLGFREHYEVIKNEINKFQNLYPIGRGGMYKYNNQDHSILSGILAARNYSGRTTGKYDLWNINEEDEYHEGSTRDNKFS
jgi:protoporphyrinogen oxidase